jgi:hypothetical protein
MYPGMMERGNERGRVGLRRGRCDGRRATILRHPHAFHLGVEPARLASTRSGPLPKRNYGLEKRQKEIRRQLKKEEKKQKKLDRAKESAETRPDEPEGLTPPGR